MRVPFPPSCDPSAVFAAVVLASASAQALDKVYTSDPAKQQHLFQQFKTNFGRTYTGDDEEATRFENFVDNLKLIDSRNAKETGSALHGVTPMADLSPAEVQRYFLNHDPLAAGVGNRNPGGFQPSTPLQKDAALVDWTGVYTTPVKYQGFCGSCWAFSAVEQIESDYLRAGGNNSIWEPTPDKGLSVQQPTSCVKFPQPGVGGCDGGWTENVFEYAETVGLESDFDYPYTSSTGGTPPACKADSSKAIIKTTGYTTVSSSPEDEPVMAAYVQSTGPLSVCVDASEWGTYVRGVMSSCGQTVDHCVQAVGIDTSAAGYWKVRNSWGTAWGERGFIRLAYGNNTCNITSDSNFAEVALV